MQEHNSKFDTEDARPLFGLRTPSHQLSKQTDMLGGSMEDGAYRPCTACARPVYFARKPSGYCLGRLSDVTASAVPVMTRWATLLRSRARNRASTARLSQQANMAGGESLPRKRSIE